MTVYTADAVRTQTDAGTIADGCVVVEGGNIAWVGPLADLPKTNRDHPRQHIAGTINIGRAHV